jgi:hypothetical protein
MVERYTGQYEGATFDGMTDMKEYHNTELVDEAGNIEIVSYGANFVFENRSYSKAWEDWAIKTAMAYYDAPTPETWIDNEKTHIYELARRILNVADLRPGMPMFVCHYSFDRDQNKWHINYEIEQNNYSIRNVVFCSCNSPDDCLELLRTHLISQLGTDNIKFISK